MSPALRIYVKEREDGSLVLVIDCGGGILVLREIRKRPHKDDGAKG